MPQYVAVNQYTVQPMSPPTTTIEGSSFLPIYMKREGVINLISNVWVPFTVARTSRIDSAEAVKHYNSPSWRRYVSKSFLSTIPRSKVILMYDKMFNNTS